MIKIESKKGEFRFKIGTPFESLRKMADRVKVTPDYSKPDRMVLIGEFQVIDQPYVAAVPEVPQIMDTDPKSITFNMIKQHYVSERPEIPQTYRPIETVSIDIPMDNVMQYPATQSHSDYIDALQAACEKGYEIECEIKL